MKFVVSFLYLAMVLMSPITWAAKTYLTLDSVAVLDSPNGAIVEQWDKRTLFTSDSESDEWITISGHFPKGQWQPLETDLFIKKSEPLKLRIPYKDNSAKTVVYRALHTVGVDAKRYKLLADTKVYFYNPQTVKPDSSSEAEDPSNEIESALQTQSVGIDAVDSKSIEAEPAKTAIWKKDTVFTSASEDRYIIKATGYVTENSWQALDKPVWIKKSAQYQDRTKPLKYERKSGSKRFAIIDKKRFELSVYEVVDGKKEKLMRTPVALGFDRCLPEEKGGKCYYTPEGEFEVEFQLFDPDGINWCIPPKMSGEYKNKIAKGERCSRGTMGNYAMHFGNSYFLHGTSNPNSIGGRTTHGCIRLRNPDIEMVYQMLDNGDKVLISDTPEEFDLFALAGQKPESELENEITPVSSEDIKSEELQTESIL
ncbi:L,D-transpeptidase [uncultured Psychrosphaera sp.]|uniref:L,D-transpeptidase n=1 Tax=uncultured Psychrosphaera sp. TaxID=1403522 RepID=UPI0026161A95|nr:L,D-transpeptidase [uncultured Psychrosphaera sp.]